MSDEKKLRALVRTLKSFAKENEKQSKKSESDFCRGLEKGVAIGQSEAANWLEEILNAKKI